MSDTNDTDAIKMEDGPGNTGASPKITHLTRSGIGGKNSGPQQKSQLSEEDRVLTTKTGELFARLARVDAKDIKFGYDSVTDTLTAAGIPRYALARLGSDEEFKKFGVTGEEWRTFRVKASDSVRWLVEKKVVTDEFRTALKAQFGIAELKAFDDKCDVIEKVTAKDNPVNLPVPEYPKGTPHPIQIDPKFSVCIPANRMREMLGLEKKKAAPEIEELRKELAALKDRVAQLEERAGLKAAAPKPAGSFTHVISPRPPGTASGGGIAPGPR